MSPRRALLLSVVELAACSDFDEEDSLRMLQAPTEPDGGALPEEGDLLVGPSPEGPPPTQQDASASPSQTAPPPQTLAWGGCQLPGGRPASGPSKALALLPLLTLAWARRRRPGSRPR
jgi:hypothetical protein